MIYFYKIQDNKFTIMDFQEIEDPFDIEEHIIKLIRHGKDKYSKTADDIYTNFNGIYTLYDFSGKYKLVSSNVPLNTDGSVKHLKEGEVISLPVKKKRNRKKKNQLNAAEADVQTENQIANNKELKKDVNNIN